MKSKDETLYCRMTSDLKERVESAARLRGESASVIVREALREYFEAKGATKLQEATPTPLKTKLKAA
jgi:predicted DNA-binding protein